MPADVPLVPHDRRYYLLVERTVDVALAAAPVPLRVLAVDCGTGEVLRELIERVPYGTEYVGIDPSDEAVRIARRESDGRLAFVCGRSEALPFPEGHFDLVLSSMAFRRWADPATVLHQMARVLKDSGRLVVIDAVPPKRMTALIEQTGLQVEHQETVHRKARLVPSVRAYVAGL
jgi:ubiquinone/menaquinone biosynthesis C-methylase UbiE